MQIPIRNKNKSDEQGDIISLLTHTCASLASSSSFVVVVVVASYFQRIGCQPEKTTVHGVADPARVLLDSENITKPSVAAHAPAPPPPSSFSFGENK